MEIVLAIVLAIVSVGIIFGGVTYLKKNLASGVGSQKKALHEQIAEYDQKLADLDIQQNNYASKAQLEVIRKIRGEISSELEQTSESLRESEQRLETAQKSVVAKENTQQKLKGIKEDEQGRLEELATIHETLSSTSLSLEKELADSMKQLDSLQTKVELTDRQKEAFQKLSEVLSATGERMRELISEYNDVNSKLAELREQYTNLEEEYTRLVEQQLTT